mmetsp:Transcript_103959/g.294562  ORF Transcript_103959/g.294562 Transcript_103959/m.294562 type:complete len:212 (+) Transcript_103959:56-691(+)
MLSLMLHCTEQRGANSADLGHCRRTGARSGPLYLAVELGLLHGQVELHVQDLRRFLAALPRGLLAPERRRPLLPHGRGRRDLLPRREHLHLHPRLEDVPRRRHGGVLPRLAVGGEAEPRDRRARPRPEDRLPRLEMARQRGAGERLLDRHLSLDDIVVADGVVYLDAVLRGAAAPLREHVADRRQHAEARHALAPRRPHVAEHLHLDARHR